MLRGEKCRQRDDEIAIAYMEGATKEELQARYGLSESATRQILREQHATRPGERVKTWTADSKARWRARDAAIHRGAHRGGLTIDELAKRFTLSPITVRKILNQQEENMHKHRGLDAVEEEAARFSFFKRRMPPDFRQISWHVQCSRCPAELNANWGPGMNPEGMSKFVKQKGWDVGHGMRPICPDCLRHRQLAPLAKPEHQTSKPYQPPQTLISARLLQAVEKRMADEPAQVIEPAQAQQQLPLEPPKPKGKHFSKEAMDKSHSPESRAKAVATRRARLAEQKQERDLAHKYLVAAIDRQERERQKRYGIQITNGHAQDAPQAEKEVIDMQMPPKVYVAVTLKLAGLFDKENGRYRHNYSDQRVAEECHAPLDQVIELREEAFGELAEDPRVSQLRNDVEALQQLLADAVTKLGEITQS